MAEIGVCGMNEIRVRKETLEIFIGAIGEVLTECRLNFHTDGIKVLAVDEANVAMVHATLPENMMDQYSSPDLVFGIDLKKFKVALSIMSDDSLILEVSDKSITLRDGKSEYNCTALDINSIRKEPKLPKISLAANATFSGAEFSEAVKQVGKIGDAVTVETSDKGLSLFVRGDTDNIRRKITTDQKKMARAKSLYSLDYLKDIAKVIRSALIVKAEMDMDQPIRFQFTTGGIDVMYLLAPRVDSDEGATE
jgi:proliferating cell nuclear antigen